MCRRYGTIADFGNINTAVQFSPQAIEKWRTLVKCFFICIKVLLQIRRQAVLIRSFHTAFCKHFTNTHFHHPYILCRFTETMSMGLQKHHHAGLQNRFLRMLIPPNHCKYRITHFCNFYSEDSTHFSLLFATKMHIFTISNSNEVSIIETPDKSKQVI